MPALWTRTQTGRNHVVARNGIPLVPATESEDAESDGNKTFE